MTRLQDKIAIVTGSGQGLGRSIARLFAREGASVVVAEINGNTAQETTELIVGDGGNALCFPIDVSDAEHAERLAKATIDTYGRIDILVNNAAIHGGSRDVADIDEATWDRVMAVNLKGAFLCSKSVIPHMRRQGSGSIVCVSSVSGFVANEHQAAYNASKHGLIGLARCMAQDCGPDGIRVNVVSPTGMNTPMMAGADPAELAPYAAMTVFSRFAEPDEIAKPVLFLASDEASFITGSVLVADGGATAMQASRRQQDEGRAAYLAKSENPSFNDS